MNTKWEFGIYWCRNELTNHEFRCWFFQYLWGVWPKAICTIEARVPFQCHSWPKPLHPRKCLEVRWWNRSNRIGGAPACNIGKFSKLWRKGWIYLIMLIQQYFTNLRSKHMLTSLLYIFTIFQFLKKSFLMGYWSKRLHASHTLTNVSLDWMNDLPETDEILSRSVDFV